MGARKKKGRKQKNRAYYMRFKPKMRRRRQAKTDYQARRTLITQEKSKYNANKLRLVVRISNKNVTCQVVNAKIIGDEVLCVAYSSELPRYGLKVGLKNYAACYATGLLCARRALAKFGLAEDYEGNLEVDGNYFNQEDEVETMDEDARPDRAPLRCFLDVGLRPTTTGARVFAAMKGAVDGGISIPHHENGKQFPGFDKNEENPRRRFNADVCRKYIFGGHVGEYMTKLQEEEPEKYESHFSDYIRNNIGADDLEDMYAAVHAKIREDPSALPKKVVDTSAIVSKYKSKRKKTMVERRDHVLNRILALRAKAEEA